MYKEIYAICLRNPLEDLPLIILSLNDIPSFTRDISRLLEAECIISYGFSHVIDEFRSAKIGRLPLVYDVETAKCLLTGRPRSEYGGNTPWEILTFIKDYLDVKARKFFDDYQNLRIIEPESCDKFEIYYVDLIKAFISSWNDMVNELNENNEYKRYFEIESPIYNLFLESQLRGIRVDQERLEEKLKNLKTEHYSNIKSLEFDHDFASVKIKTNMSWDDILVYCNFGDGKEEFDYDFWTYVDIYSEFSTFLSKLLSARRSKIDFNALLRYRFDSYGRIYPRFQILGTVTGRVLVSSPGVQYLKKTSRDIFIPDSDNIFIYADFAQFEPGIVASFSKDKKLIDIYNTGDIYSALSETLFKEISVEKRKLSKTIFLSYLYGMREDRLFKVIENLAGIDSAKNGMQFFKMFDQLMGWKDEVCEQAKNVGFSSSVFGNRRYTETKGNLSAMERRWVPNQMIQGTASYIFKKSLLQLKNEIKECQIHIPMHDAILLEVPKENEADCKIKIREIFINEFQAVCKGIRANVSFESFSG